MSHRPIDRGSQEPTAKANTAHLFGNEQSGQFGQPVGRPTVGSHPGLDILVRCLVDAPQTDVSDRPPTQLRRPGGDVVARSKQILGRKGKRPGQRVMRDRLLRGQSLDQSCEIGVHAPSNTNACHVGSLTQPMRRTEECIRSILRGGSLIPAGRAASRLAAHPHAEVTTTVPA